MTHDSTLVSAALAYAQRGWKVFPLKPQGKTSLFPTADCGGASAGCQAQCGEVGHGYLDATSDPQVIEQWWSDEPNANIGIACGMSGLYAIDIDTKTDKVGAETLAALEAEHGKLSETYTVRSWSGGLHYYFLMPETLLKNTAGEGGLGKDIDTRGNGYVVAPPSLVTEKGETGTYSLLVDAPVAELPQWVVTKLTAKRWTPPKRSEPRVDTRTGEILEGVAGDAQGRLRQLLAELADVQEGRRNETLNRLAGMAYGYVAAGQLDDDAVTEEFRGVAIEIGLQPAEIEGTLRSARNFGLRNPYEWTVKRPFVDGPTEQSEPDLSDRPYGLLPEAFWESRPVLQHIRQAAHADCCSGDAVLYSVLTRMSGMISHKIKANTGIKGRASLNLYAAVVGGSGTNKSSSVSAAKGLSLVPNRDFLDELPLGSGEGIAEAFMGTKTHELEMDMKTGKVKTETARCQVRHNAFFYVDEGELIARLKERQGSTLGESIRRAWGGETLGQTNATEERTRYVPGGSYALGLLVGFQPSTALPVLRDSATGTAQRFLWVQAVDPTIPLDEEVPHPGPLNVYPQLREPEDFQEIHFPEEIRKEIRRTQVLRGRGELEVDPLDTHEHLVRAKLSALLALLDARGYVIEEDWALSEVMWKASCELRNALLERSKREEVAQEAEKLAKTVRTEVAKAEAVGDVDRNIEARARWIWKQVTGGTRRSELNKRSASKYRPYLVRALDLALARDWLVEGDDMELSPGNSRPGN